MSTSTLRTLPLRPIALREPRVLPTSVPICPASPRPAVVRRSRGGDVIALYVAVSIYVASDVAVFHLLSGWLTAILEAVELAPICIGVVAFRRTAARRALPWSGLPKVVAVPVVATVIQLEMLACAGLYRFLSPA